ncbi:hypothetical protein ACIBI3_22125 [Actinomadura luteofluorescens]
MGGDPFAPETLAGRSAANQRLLQRGLFDPRRPAPGPARPV